MQLRITSSVGKGGKNIANDVKVVRALLNVYMRQQSSAGKLKIEAKNNSELEEAIFSFQKLYLKVSEPDSRIDPNGRSFRGLKQVLSSVFKPLGVSEPSYGAVTWSSEGAEGGPYHSRKLHVPSFSSGLTIGRGYDMKTKTSAKIYADLIACGVASNKAEVLKKAESLKGSEAQKFICEHDLLDFQISPDGQKKLFKISYDLEEADVKRICAKKDVVLKYGKTDWDSLNSRIKDVVVDLKFRGDYTGSSRKLIQKAIADNNLDEFKKAMIDKSNWSSVPEDRFKRRKKFLETKSK